MKDKRGIEIVEIAALVITMLAVLTALSLPVMAVCSCNVATGGCPCACGTKGFVINGTVYVDGPGSSELKKDHVHVDFGAVPAGTIKWARVYWHVWMPGNWTDATFCNANQCWGNNQTICDASEPWCTCDQDETDGFYGGGCGTTWVYWNVTDKVTSGGPHNITIDNRAPGADGRTFWVYLVVVVDDLTNYPEDQPETVTRYWVNQGYGDSETGDKNTTWFNGVATTGRNSTLWHHGLCSDVTSGGIWFNGRNVRTDIPYDLTEEEIDGSWVNSLGNNMTWDNGNDDWFHPVLAIFMDSRQPGKDLIVPDIELPKVMRPNTSYTVKATIKNNGNLNVEATNPFEVKLYVDNNYHDTETITGLNAGASKTVSFSQQVSLASGCHEFKVVADAGGVVVELNEGNNDRIEKGQVGNVIVVEKNSDFGVLLAEGLATNSGNTYYIEDLEIENCAGDGISIENTDYPFVINNCTVQDCSASGVFLNNVTLGTINGSVIKNNTDYGVEIGLTAQQEAMNPEFINITNNTILEDRYGIELIGRNCSVRNNTIKDNTGYGIYVFGNDNNITYNDIKDNHDYGVKMFDSYENWIYGNSFIGNNIDFSSRTSQGWDNQNNHWNNSGNYWSDYTGVDENPDNGFGDTDYDIDGGTAKDEYPLCYRDLEITKVWVNWPTDCKIYYNITNIGRRIVTLDHNTALYVNGAAKPQDTVSEDLSAGEIYTGYFNYDWNYTPSGDNVDVCADKTGIVVECDKSNNWLNDTWMCGNVDGNTKVNLADYITLRAYVKKAPGWTIESNWAADVNCDGKGTINLADYITLRAYVKKAPGWDLCCNCE